MGLLVILHGSSLPAATSVLNYHNDHVSSGVNSSEVILTPASLTVDNFSKRFAMAVDGQVYAQPLYVPGVVVTGGALAGVHNLVFAATQHDSLYAIDADSGLVIWKTSFLSAGLPGATSIAPMPATDSGSTDTAPEIGICATPVIDPATNLLYVTAKTKQILNGVSSAPHYVYTLYKIDITNGNATANANIVSETVFGDTIFSGSVYTYRTNSDPSGAQDPFVPGTGDGAITVGGQSRVYFNAMRQMNRPGLLLSNGTIYVAFASHGDTSPYHGWLLGFDKNTLAVTAVLNSTPNGGLGGIWESGSAPAVDANGNIFVVTGNGTFDGFNNNGAPGGLDGQGFPASGDYGDSFVKISPDATTSAANQNINGWGLKVVDYFTPFNAQVLNDADNDLGSGGCILLPDSAGNGTHPHLLVGAGKEGKVYLIDRDSMGQFAATTDNVVQSQVAISASFDTPAFFNGLLYYVGASDFGKAFGIADATMSTTPVQAPNQFGWPGSTPSISANGTSDGMVWTLDLPSGELRAYSADDFTNEIWNSALAPNNRDQLGTPSKFATPTIADGHVFVGTKTALVVYGITPTNVPPAPIVSASPATAIDASSATLNGTVNPKGSAVTVHFQYGTTTSYGNTTSDQSEGSGTTNVTFTTAISGLAPQTVYHFRAVATNSGTTVYGTDRTFTTLAAPVIGASPMAYLGASGAEVSQTVNPNGIATSVFFEYGTTTSYGTQTATQNVGRGRVAVNVYGLLPDLAPTTTYHYRLVTTSAAGTFFGADETFTTLPFDTTQVVQKADSAPIPGVSGATFFSFGSPAINIHDHTAFKATLTTGPGGVTIGNNIGIWADDTNGTRQMIARIGSDAAPGTTATFVTLSDPVYNDNDAVAFRGTLKVAVGQATLATAIGIWCNSAGSLALVARQGDQAQGCPTGATFANFSQVVLADQGGATNQGGVIVLATLNVNAVAGVRATNNLGIWAVDTAGTLQLIVRTGGSLNGKTITGLTFLSSLGYVTGQSRSFAHGSGNLVYLATFSDKSNAILSVAFP